MQQAAPQTGRRHASGRDVVRTLLGSAREAGTALRASYGWVVVPLTIGVGVRLALFALGSLAVRLLAPERFDGPLAIWQRWDADWYLIIAAAGYDYDPAGQSRAAFFPLFPLVVRLGDRALDVVAPGDHALGVSMAISWVAFALACVVLYRLTLDRFGPTTAEGSVVLLATYPFGCFFGAPFTESLYLLLALITFYGISREKWWLASLAAMLAGATRPPGWILGACVMLAYALHWLRTRHRPRWDALWLLLTPLGIGAYLYYCWARFGDALAFAKTAEAGWGRGGLKTEALGMVWRLLIRPDTLLQGDDPATVMHSVYAIVTALALLSIVPTARLLGAPAALFAASSIAMPILTFNALDSVGRYVSIIFPMYIVAAHALRARPGSRLAIVAACAVFLGLFTVLYLLGNTVY